MNILTYTPKEPEQMSSEELTTELICQRHIARYFRTRIYRARGIVEHDRAELEKLSARLRECDPESEEYKDLHYKTARKTNALKRSEQKLAFCEMYETNIRGLIEYLSDLKQEKKAYELAHRQRGYDPKGRRKKKETAELRDLRLRLSFKKKVTKKQIRAGRKAGAVRTWDRDKFMLVVLDRGIRLEETLYYELSRLLDLTPKATKELLRSGTFTMEQAMKIGGFFEMSPKEFVDIFLRGYFVEEFGEYRARYE